MLEASAREFLSLYKRVLTLHRRVLPHAMRELGDTYVRSEFRLHRDANQQHRVKFLAEWESYAKALENKTVAQLGRNLNDAQLRALNDEQRKKLGELKQSSTEGKWFEQ